MSHSNTVQVGVDTWIKRNPNATPLAADSEYFIMSSTGKPCLFSWEGTATDYALAYAGNLFLTTAAASDARLPAVHLAPVTYANWVTAGKPALHFIDTRGYVAYRFMPADTAAIVFASSTFFFTEIAALAWIADFNSAGISNEN